MREFPTKSSLVLILIGYLAEFKSKGEVPQNFTSEINLCPTAMAVGLFKNVTVFSQHLAKRVNTHTKLCANIVVWSTNPREQAAFIQTKLPDCAVFIQ